MAQLSKLRSFMETTYKLLLIIKVTNMYFQEMSQLEQNGPEFQYIVSWRRKWTSEWRVQIFSKAEVTSYTDPGIYPAYHPFDIKVSVTTKVIQCVLLAEAQHWRLHSAFEWV